MERYRDIERSIITTYRKSIWRRFIKGINAYKMINEGDRIAVIVSGDKSSAAMAKCVQEIHRHGVVKFGMEFIASDKSGESTAKNAEILNIPLCIFGAGEDELSVKAKKLGCNKIARGDNFDDVIETIIGSLLLDGEIKTLMPKQRLNGIEIIRPMYMVKEKDIDAWARHNELEFTRRENNRPEIKELVKTFRRTSPYIDMNIYNSVQNVNLTTVIGYHGKGREYNFLDDYDERGKSNA